MTPAQLIAARDGSGNASASALALWAAVTARENVEAAHAGAAVDLIGKHVGATTDMPDAVLREAVVRLALFLHNTEGPAGMGLGLSEFQPGEDTGFRWPSEFHGAALRRSGVMGLLLPWTAKRAGAI